ncbi:WYL domain-containing protein [Mesorhizobium sp.]|uniref:helix-turn-helix transcriptional regulator n=1 Tax=Mesorhizobium sp. TaxID=1871066 RepID=UPI000FE87C6E|nr:WYL domain-containing protein [Mesorhizobium sp.]RWJ32022.1 MAG: WYL domain-containing protein [Mesorhizobium sp.]TIQ73771.1 MAG: WYL domain-containing protein [Mesorhizobium sp.]
MGKESADLRWGVEQRLEFIEFRLFWEGGLNRADITRYFGVSVPQASKDLSQYQALVPDNIVYDRSEKRYFASKNFTPRFLKPDPDRYLSQLRMIAEGAIGREESWVVRPPSFETLPMPRRHVDPEVLRTILAAIREKQALEIRYQSLSGNRPQATWRWISPHAIAYDGQRWHVRAFCHLDRGFKDFLLPRVLKTRANAPAEAPPEQDTIWSEIVSVALKPHPGLSDEQKHVVAQDFGMKAGRLEIKLRLALLYYLLKRLNLDFEEEKRPAREQHVVLADPDGVRQALRRAQAPSQVESSVQASG